MAFAWKAGTVAARPRRRRRGWLAWLTLSALLLAGSQARGETRLLRMPDTQGEHIAFVYAGDIYIAGLDGSEPRRLTAATGQASHPHFSPDGRRIAFTARYEGNSDVYVVSVEGGQPERLTYHPGEDVVRGWSRDGKRVVFTSPRQLTYQRGGHLFEIAIEGGFPDKLAMPLAWDGDYSPDGTRIAYQPFPSADSGTSGWKGYRGGRTPPIWLFDRDSHAIQRIPNPGVNNRHPQWVGGTVYFVSDRGGTANLWAFDPAAGELDQLTRHTGWGVDHAAASKRAIVYSRGGWLYRYDRASGDTRRLDITLNPDLSALRPRAIDGENYITEAVLGPQGSEAVFTARGEIVVLKDGKTMRNLTKSSGARERDPLVAPGGERIAYLGDAGGEYALYIAERTGLSEPRRIALAGGPAYYRLHGWSPDGETIVYADNHLNLYALDVEDGDSRRIARHARRWKPGDFEIAFSPDSRWLAYTKVEGNFLRSLVLYDLAEDERVTVTDGMSSASTPVFSRDGRYLFFTASTNIGPANAWLDMSNRERPVRRGVYAAVLAEDGGAPLPWRPPADARAEEGDEADAVPETHIEAEGLRERIVGLPMPQRDYTALIAGADRALYALAERQEGVVGVPDRVDSEAVDTLYRYDLGAMKTRVYLEDVAEVAASRDGSRLLVRRGEAQWARLPAGRSEPQPSQLDLESIELSIDPRAEWRQIFREAWRIERDFFYDPDMHGADWSAIRERYAALLDHVGTRSDLNFLLVDMLSELRAGHTRVSGGDIAAEDGPKVGLLGADWTIENGRYRLEHIYRGDRWRPFQGAPLGLPGLGVEAGDYLLAVDGERLAGTDNLYRFLDGKVGKRVVLTFSERPEDGPRWEIFTQPIAEDRPLRRAAWIKANRQRVDALSDGRVAYIYLPDTKRRGFARFNRAFFAQIDKQAAVIDIRGNRGGQAADYIVNALTRSYLGSWKDRHGPLFRTPLGAIFGPKAMIIDQFAGSGGDFLPYAFRREGAGPLVGARSWGGLIGIGISPDLIDGGEITAPYFRFLHPDGHWAIENTGVRPDIPVEMTPKAVIGGGDPQLERAVEAVLEELEDYEPVAPQQAPPPPAPARP